MKNLAAALILLAGTLPLVARADDLLSHGRFEKVMVVKPADAPKSFVLLLTDQGGWDTNAARFAHALAQDDAMVAVVPLPAFYAQLEQEIVGCEFTDGDLENLSHFVQAYYRMPGYIAPILVGFGEGAAFVYANLAQAPGATFGGAVTLGFCPKLHLRQELCAGEGFVSRKSWRGFSLQPAAKLPAHWVALQGASDKFCLASDVQKFTARSPRASLTKVPDVARNFSAAGWLAPLRSAYAKLAAENPHTTAPPPESLGDLPVLEVLPKIAAPQQPLAIFFSGDGGWAGLDEEVAAALSARGVPVIGVDSLRYFWIARKPEGLAADLDRIIRYYSAQWQRDQVLLIGYSQGADVLPFALNHLPPASRKKVRLAAAMGLGERAAFEFHLANWVSSVTDGYEIKPEVEKIQGTPFLCIYGEEEDDSTCPKLSGSAARVIKLPGDHHFNGNYGRLADEILKAAAARN